MNRLPTAANQRCLFHNDCVQAHLLGLNRQCPCFESCVPSATTVIVTYGVARAFLDGAETPLFSGRPLHVPPACPLRLITRGEADVLLLQGVADA